MILFACACYAYIQNDFYRICSVEDSKYICLLLTTLVCFLLGHFSTYLELLQIYLILIREFFVASDFLTDRMPSLSLQNIVYNIVICYESV